MKKNETAKFLGILISVWHFQKSGLFIPISVLIPSDDQ